MSEIKKMNLESADLIADRIEMLRNLFPEIVTEGEGTIDFDKLRLILGDDVDDASERYAFTWPGKAAAIRQSQTSSNATLRPCIAKSRGRDGEDGSFDTDNIYIEGDNLEVLKLLQRGYHGRIKMIYIDPPYNTGNDFVYKDAFDDTIASYKKQTGLIGQSNPDTSGRYHSDWCSMMYPRLRLARELLHSRGAICISIDDREVAALKLICNEIFGEQSFVAQIPRQSRKSVQNDTDISSSHEYVLIYAKCRRREHRRLRENNANVWHSMESFACYPKKLDASRYANPDNDPRGPWKADPFDAPNVRPNLTYSITNPNTGEKYDPPVGRHWRTEFCKYQELLEDERIVFGVKGTSGPQLKVFYEEKRAFGEIDNTWWDADRISVNSIASKQLMSLFDGLLPFDTPKPVSLIENLIRLTLPLGEENIVLDFFSGSASSAHAVIDANRNEGSQLKYIMVQLPESCPPNSPGAALGFETLCDIGEERIRRVGNKIKAEVEDPKSLPDIGFRVFELDESGIQKPGRGELLDNVVRPDRSDLDIVFEMMLKWGLQLTLPVERVDVAGYPVWSVGCDELVCCMANELTQDALEAIAAMEPRRVLILDSILTDTLKLNAIEIFKHAGERSGREIELRTI